MKFYGKTLAAHTPLWDQFHPKPYLFAGQYDELLDANMTCDRATGLDRPNLTLYTDRSFEDISGEFGIGGDCEGGRSLHQEVKHV